MLRAPGVYAGQVSWPGVESRAAVVNVGRRPTVVARGDVVVEVHLLDFDGDLYGRRLQVTLKERLRDEQRFTDLEALTQQIARDVQRARAVMAGSEQSTQY